MNTFSFFLVTRRNKEKFFFSFFFHGMSLYNTILRAKMSLNLCTSFKLHSILHFLFHYLWLYISFKLPWGYYPHEHNSGKWSNHLSYLNIYSEFSIYILMTCRLCVIVYFTIVHVYKYIIQA